MVQGEGVTIHEIVVELDEQILALQELRSKAWEAVIEARSTMKLTRENIREWRDRISVEALPIFGKDFGECCSDEEWLDLHEDDTPWEAIEENIRACL